MGGQFAVKGQIYGRKDLFISVNRANLWKAVAVGHQHLVSETCIWGFRTGLTQTKLYNYRNRLEA